ncbi:hypothetical protein JK358_01275 [Nocardia sp. 2]|uniref:Uncharacterized protein n=1 Tax=Nocardia acididurans TaxID=2802282 RepID=A0ABS1LXT1_9NOCA|nr:hypothetical protein [Nocardia acididurans]MBL1073016.1 hypothetical protein [Nocardia acididurans]
MTEVDLDAFILPELTELGPMPVSTPMRRAASQLQKVLPPGWRVEVVAVPPRPGRGDLPALRLVVPEL